MCGNVGLGWLGDCWLVGCECGVGCWGVCFVVGGLFFEAECVIGCSPLCGGVGVGYCVYVCVAVCWPLHRGSMRYV